MKIVDGIFGLPQTLELGEEKEEIYPVAVEDDEGLILIDAGLPGNLEVLEENLAEQGFSIEGVEKLVLTHQDFDHCGCAAELVEETDATVFAHEEDAPAIDGREDPIKGEERYPALDVDVELVGGETIKAGDRELEIIHTPGHTPGHISILTGNLLIAGDAVNVEEEGFSGPRERFTPEMEEATESVHKLSFREYETVHCFHGGTVEASNQDVKEIGDELGKEFRGFEQVSVEGPVKFLRQELENDHVGLSVFQIPEGESHGAQNDPEAGHRHSEQTEIYYFQEGYGTFRIGSLTEKFEAGDAFMVKAFKYRRIDAEEDTEVFIAGAPVNEKAEEGELE
jgi:glyoxylase-like metal-dependent hydrolase (beta-lactamase superfamily II)